MHKGAFHTCRLISSAFLCFQHAQLRLQFLALFDFICQRCDLTVVQIAALLDAVFRPLVIVIDLSADGFFGKIPLRQSGDLLGQFRDAP